MFTEVSTHQLIKIWFSRPGTHPLGGVLNEIRLIRHRGYFPNDDILLISNFEDFDEEDQKKLKDFCTRSDVKVTLLGLSDIENRIQSATNLKDKETQLALLRIAREEIKQGSGCLAAASDIVRALTPVTSLMRIYTDFDSRKIRRNNKEEYNIPILDIPFGVLISGEISISEKGAPQFSNVSNDLFVCDETRTDLFLYYREMMLKAYTEKVAPVIMCILKELKTEYHFDDEAWQKVSRSFLGIATRFENQNPISKVFSYRIAAKETFTKEQFDIFLMKQVVSMTGPDCLLGCVEGVIPKEFLEKCVKQGIPNRERPRLFKQISFEQQIIQKTGDQNFGLFYNEDDTSWLSVDSRKDRLAEYKKAALLFSQLYRFKKDKCLLVDKRRLML